MSQKQGKKNLTEGNIALVEAAIGAGCRFYAGYPITPQNEVPMQMSIRMPEVGGVFIQAESELAAINMVYGASAAGARAMTSSSSPGISLKQEGISYLSGAELPAVVVNMMRGGPGLGNIQPSQSDYFQATRGGGHGDYRTIVLAPAAVQELVELTFLAFDLAELYRVVVLILGDAILGQMKEPWALPERPVRLKRPAKDYILTGAKDRPPRVLKSLYLFADGLETHNLRLQDKYRRIEKREVRCEKHRLADADLILVAYGMMARVAKAVVKRCRAEGIRAGLLRPITLWPFPTAVLRRAAESAKAILTVEMSHGQLVEDVRLAVEGRAPVAFFGRAGGGIPTPDRVYTEAVKVVASLKKKGAAGKRPARKPKR